VVPVQLVIATPSELEALLIGGVYDRKQVPAQPVDATPYNQLISQYVPSRINPYGSTQSEPKQGF
jgi:hypothetical protein